MSEGILKATYEPIPRLDNPKYYTHFTLSKYDNGIFQLQNHPEDASWASLLKNGSQMSTGYYMLVTGSRMANGSVLSQVSFFTVEEGKTTVTPLCMRNNTEEVRVIGNFNSEALYTRPDNGEQVSILSTTGRGYYIVGVLGVGQEPTNHALKDIEIKKAEFENGDVRLYCSLPTKRPTGNSTAKSSPTCHRTWYLESTRTEASSR